METDELLFWSMTRNYLV